MWISDPLTYTRKQQCPADEETRLKEKAKLAKVQKRGYIGIEKRILSLTSYFSVPKGDANICMVYNGTKSGLNAALYAPWFALATVDAMLRSVDVSTWLADNNFGEMFLNFGLHPKLRVYAGIDHTALFPEEVSRPSVEGRPKRKVLWEAWNQCAMGLTTSPYQATQSAQRAKRSALGDRLDPNNVF
ncbi:hypothetical protein ACA910_007271 [Epithemia clementina (nom. ined.)]